MLRKDEAIARAINAGATMDEINAEAALQARNVGSVPFNNMLRALNMLTFRNTQADWTRLAAGMIARANARKRK